MTRRSSMPLKKVFENFVTKPHLIRLISKISRKGGEAVEMDFEQLYNTYYMQVYSFVMALSCNRDISEEITQKTFFRAITAGRKYAGNSSELTWLCAIAKNLFTDELRQQKKNCAPGTEEKASGISVESAVVNEDSAFLIHQALHNLEEL